MDAVCLELEKTAALRAFGDELQKLAASSKLPFQPYKFVKSDKHVMNAYWNELGDDVEAAEDTDKPLSEAAQKKEMKYVNALRKYYRAAAKSEAFGYAEKPGTTDRDIKKNIAQNALGIGVLSSLGGLVRMARMGVPAKHLPAASAGVFGLGALVGGGLSWRSVAKHPHFTTPKTKAREASKFSDEQLVELLRGRPITEEKVKKTEMYI
jgi:hypothetical protein